MKNVIRIVVASATLALGASAAQAQSCGGGLSREARTVYDLAEDQGVHFLVLELAPEELRQAARLSFVQGLYEVAGDALRPLATTAEWRLHEDFVFGSKFRGKTNEHLTQMLLNVGWSFFNFFVAITSSLRVF